MKPRLKIKRKEPPEGGLNFPSVDAEVVTPQKSSNIYDSKTEWAIPPDSRDGLEVFIGQRGGIVLKQSPMMAHEQSIVLHPSEARKLLQVLPAAIRAALNFRKANHG